MFPAFDLFLARVKAYGQAVLGIMLLIAFLLAGISVVVMRHQRNVARAQAQALILTIKGYQTAADAARARVETAVARAEVSDLRHVALVGDLKASLPKTPEEAIAWAIKSGAKIGQETR